MRIQLKRGTEAQNDAFVGLEGELTVDMTNWTLRLHDGVTIGGRIVGTVTPATGGGQNISVGSVVDGDIVIAQIGSNWLAVAPASKRQEKKWGLYGIDTTLPNLGSLGDQNGGFYNTNVLINNYNSTSDSAGNVGSPAAQYCNSLGYFLPSIDELDLIRQNQSMIDSADQSGGTNTLAFIGGSNCWSSSENNNNGALIMRLNTGYIYSPSKNDLGWVLPVRFIPV